MSERARPPVPAFEELERLIVNNDQLERIETFLGSFNPIRVMRMERMEIRHSAILAWLLDPRESHGLGDRFLRAFLGEALRGCVELGYPNALDISRADLRDTDVKREWENMDIVLRSATNCWAFVIENKYDSQQSEGQLSRYIEKLNLLFDAKSHDLKIRGIFLTLYDEEPHDKSYAPIGYETVCDLLTRLLNQNATSLTNEVSIFIRHYIEILKEALGMSEEHNEMEKLARQLYRTHRKALDFIMEYGQETHFEFAVRSLIGDNDDFSVPVLIDAQSYHFGWVGSDWASFLPHSWFVALGSERLRWEGCEKWWLEYPLAPRFEFSVGGDGVGGRISLINEVGPIANSNFRRELIEAIQGAAEKCGSQRIRFQQGAAEDGRRYSRFLKQNSVTIGDVQEPSEIAKAMTTLLKRFQPEFDAIGEILPQFQSYGVE
ncbi:PD-(D/E)XK nuclease family protein [Croceicoccus bisphenolivorans]|uniref:PDDEXK-like family protein n=1 Tax=Croceicoccus bisphenolivorans TaxID=1783232 RepID=UPI00082B48CC|nr:PD-(D/E)XK nuclease family protein [Croceicoccus bisphenolivorans]